MTNVVVVIGAGQIGQAIARRVSVGKHVVLADRSEANANVRAPALPLCSRSNPTNTPVPTASPSRSSVGR